MAGIIYLDIDDEITSAATRIRDAKDARVALVLPAGSRVATSRINFRLLAREAQSRRRQLSIVAPEGSARSLAASAGLPAYSSVTEYEEAAAGRKPSTSGADSNGSPGPSAEGDALGAAGVAAGVAGGVAGGGGIRAAARGGLRAVDSPATDSAILTPVPREPEARPARPLPTIEGGRRRGRAGLFVLVGLLALGLVVAGVAGYLLLPSASIVVTPHAETIGPLQLSVRADPAAIGVDPAGDVVPAQPATIPLSASGDFPATGTKVKETKATGIVRFTSRNTASRVRIPAGTQVSTGSGIVFVTTQDVIVPKAVFIPPTPGIANAPITAVVAGTAGNVPAGSITHVSTSVQAQLVNSDDPVNNEQPTGGGTRKETQVVQRKDVDTAMATLKKSLADQLAAAISDPGRLPAGSTAFPDTKSMTVPTPTVDPTTLIGKEVATFSLGLAATGTVTTVDEAQVEQLAQQKVRGSVSPGRDLVADSVSVKVGAGHVEGSAVTFPVSATARQLRRLDLNDLKKQVKGRTIEDARSVLSQYGDVRIDVWPSFVTTIPSFDFRLDVRIGSASAEAAPPTVGGLTLVPTTGRPAIARSSR